MTYEHVTIEQMVEAMRGIFLIDWDNEVSIMNWLGACGNCGRNSPMTQLEQEGQVEVPSHLTASGNPEICCVRHITPTSSELVIKRKLLDDIRKEYPDMSCSQHRNGNLQIVLGDWKHNPFPYK